MWVSWMMTRQMVIGRLLVALVFVGLEVTDRDAPGLGTDAWTTTRR